MTLEEEGSASLRNQVQT